MHLTDNQTKVRDALPTDGTAAPADVAEATGLAYSTVTRLLRELADIGAAVKDPEGWRRPDPTTDEATTTPAAARTVDTAGADHPDPAEADPVGTDEPDGPGDVDHGEPDADDIESHDLTDHADEASDPTAEAAEDTTPVLTLNNGADTAAGATVTATGDGEATDQGNDGVAGPPAADQPRLGKGRLRDRVLVALRAATEPLGPTQLSKILDGRSQGAISNACDRLVGTGDAVLVNEAPRRFQATRTTT